MKVDGISAAVQVLGGTVLTRRGCKYNTTTPESNQDIMSYNPPNTSRRMPRHIRGFCVTSARKFKMINDPRRPNKKENGRTSANSVHVLRVLELITQAWKKFEYGFCR